MLRPFVKVARLHKFTPGGSENIVVTKLMVIALYFTDSMAFVASEYYVKYK